MRTDLTRLKWRQVRIFSSNPEFGQWYLEILAEIIHPFVAEFSDTPFYFAKYTCEGMSDGTDIGNHSLKDLPLSFWTTFPGYSQKIHRSVRLRFAIEKGSEEEAIGKRLKAFPGKLFTFCFDDFKPIEGIAVDYLYSAEATNISKESRAIVVGNLLWCNSAFLLQLLGMDKDGKYSLEPNKASNLGSSHGVLHLLLNPYTFLGGESLSVLTCNKPPTFQRFVDEEPIFESVFLS